jgi:Cu+-exporting ATPase
LARADEARSGHPFAQAVLDELERRGLANDPPIDDLVNLPGYGVRATARGRHILVGAPRLLQRLAQSLGRSTDDTVDSLVSDGKIVILVAVDGQIAGAIAAADIVRPNARAR